MSDLVLDADGRRVLLEAMRAELAPPTPASAALLDPVGVPVETGDEAARLIAEMAPLFAGVDQGFVTIDHRRAAGVRVVLGLAASPDAAFVVGGARGGRTLVSRPIPLEELIGDLIDVIGFEVPADAELEEADDAALDDGDPDEDLPPSTATTVGVVAALIEVFDGAPETPISRAEALARLGPLATRATADAVLDALLGDALLSMNDDGTVTAGPIVASAPGLAEVASGDRLELVRFALSETADGRSSGAGVRLTFAGPPGRRHAVLREHGAEDVTIARLPLADLVLLLTTFILGRSQPAVLPVLGSIAIDHAAAAEPGPIALDAAQIATPGDDTLLNALTAPRVIVEVVADELVPPTRIAASIGEHAAVAWTWHRTHGSATPFDGSVPAMAVALAEAISDALALHAVPVIYLECRWRDADDQVTGATLSVAFGELGRSDLAAMLQRQFETVAWPPGFG